MGLIGFPDKTTWEQRKNLISKEIEDAESGFVYSVSDHAIALFIDMQLAYCAGAWLSVIITSISVIDAHLRETEAMDDTIGTAKLLNEYYDGDDINWLRQLRNKYVHLHLDNPTLEMNVWFDRNLKFEEDATKAIKMTIKALFQNSGI